MKHSFLTMSKSFTHFPKCWWQNSSIFPALYSVFLPLELPLLLCHPISTLLSHSTCPVITSCVVQSPSDVSTQSIYPTSEPLIIYHYHFLFLQTMWQITFIQSACASVPLEFCYSAIGINKYMFHFLNFSTCVAQWSSEASRCTSSWCCVCVCKHAEWSNVKVC
jgi:hypothetical protein